MTGSVIVHLIRKDLCLQRSAILFSMAAGIVGLGVFEYGGEVPMVIGSVWFFVSMIVLGSMLPIASIVNERKKQNLAFLMSLPVSSIQYTVAKMVSSLILFLLPWLTLLGAALIVLEARPILTHGAIPMICILGLMPMIGFSLITGAALVGESEGWCIAATLVCNSSYGVTWYLLTRVHSLTASWSGPVAVWNPMVVRTLSIEIGSIVVCLVLTFFLQSRKRDFI